MFREAGVPCGEPVTLRPPTLPRFAAAPALAQLEAGLATPIGLPIESPESGDRSSADAVRVLECRTHRDELRQAARFIRQKIADSGGKLRFRDFAVIARDLEPLTPLVADVFGEYGIPYFLDRRRPLRSHPVSQLVETLFSTAASDFSVAAMTRLLRTGLLPLTRAQAEVLENIVAVHAVRGVDAWRKPAWDFTRDPRDSESAIANDPDLHEARRRIVAAIEPLLNLAATGATASGATWARTLHDVLEALGVRRQIEAWMEDRRGRGGWERAETHRLAWDAVCNALTDLHDVLGETELTAGDAATILGSALREQTLGLAPPTLDQVLVSAIERSRHPDIKYAWLMALNEGVFPSRPPDDPLLDADERQMLAEQGLRAPASRRDDAFGERLLAYIALTRPSRGLVISYALEGEEGAPLLPSPLLSDVRRALPELHVQQPRAAHAAGVFERVGARVPACGEARQGSQPLQAPLRSHACV